MYVYMHSDLVQKNHITHRKQELSNCSDGQPQHYDS